MHRPLCIHPPAPAAARLLLACVLAVWLACMGATPAQAQGRVGALLPAAPVPAALPALTAPAAPPADTDGTPLIPVDELRKQLNAIPQKLGEEDDGRKLLTDISTIGKAAERVVTRRTTELAELDRRLEGLGPAPEKGSPADAPDVVRQRKALDKQRAALDAELKLARLVAVDAEQRSAELQRQRRALFQAQLTRRTDSPLSPAYWRNMRNAAPGDAVRLSALGAELRAAVRATLD